MNSIQQAIHRAVSENRMGDQTLSDTEATDRIWAEVQATMRAEGMILFDKPVTTTMLHRQIEETGRFEQALAEVAQELNEAISNVDYAASRKDAGQAIKALLDTARQVVTMVEQANPSWPLYKQSPMSDEDRLWEYHLLRGTVPSDQAIDAVRHGTP